MPEQDVQEDVDVDDRDFEAALRHQIFVVVGHKGVVTDQVQDVIVDDVFHHDGRLVVVRRSDDGCVLVPLSRESLDDLINRRCRFTRQVARGRGEDRRLVDEDIDAPKWLSETIYGLVDRPRLRELKQITSVPYLRPDGSVGGLQPGYDAISKCWTDIPERLTPPPQCPTDEQAMESLKKIEDVLREFPFANRVGVSVVVAAILTILARRLIRGSVPLFLVDASKSGSGKTLLARIVAIIGSGADPGLANSGSNETEFRKTITSFLMSGQPVLVLDNQVGKLGGAELDRFQTAGRWQDRLLNHNCMATLKNEITTLVTSNNAQIFGDTGRRSLEARIVPHCERPERRVFDRKDLLGHVMDRRRELALAAITVVRWHLAKGCPEAAVANHVLQDGTVVEMPVESFGSFEAWSRLVRHAVIGLGLPDPVATQEDIHDLDEQFMAEKRFVLALAESDSTWEGTAEDLVSRLYESDDLRELRTALSMTLSEKDVESGKLKPSAVGYKLRSLKDRRFGDWAIESRGKGKGGVRWGIKNMAAGEDEDG
jgi:hypothetical protein